MELTKGGRLEGLWDWFGPSLRLMKRRMADSVIWNEWLQVDCDTRPVAECLSLAFGVAMRRQRTRRIPSDMTYQLNLIQQRVKLFQQFG